MRLGVSTYSFWHFRGEPYPVERVLEDAARLGVAGCEVLEAQLGADTPRTRLHGLRRRALALGLDLYAVSTHQDFVSPEAAVREAQIARTVRSLELAAELGVGCIRVNSGRWKTIPGFDTFMAAGGVEPPLAGHTEADAFAWVIDALGQLLPHAERLGVMLALENHWGLTASAAGVRRIVGALPSPHLGVVLDTGNYLRGDGDTYAQMEALAPLAVLVHAKSYLGGPEWYDLDIDYTRVGAILRQAGYRGYVSLEFEGRAPAAQALPVIVEGLRRDLGVL